MIHKSVIYNLQDACLARKVERILQRRLELEEVKSSMWAGIDIFNLDSV